MADKIRKYKKAFTSLSAELGREPTDQELAEYLDISLNKLRRIKQSIILEPISLETSVTDDLSLGDYIEDKKCNLPEEQVKENFLKSDIPQIFDNLTEREKKVITMRFGINSSKPKTLAELGEVMGYSKERIRQIEEGAIKKLRRLENISHLKDYIDN